jgi:GNAT superfamily N-acetyltransferase
VCCVIGLQLTIVGRELKLQVDIDEGLHTSKAFFGHQLMAPLTIAQTFLTPEKIPEYVTLLQDTFPGAKERYNPAYLNWLYYENPNGRVIGFDAWDGNRAVAHYVCIPLQAYIQSSSPRKILLSLNTATHPDYQGKGLFVKLASQTYALAAEQNYEAVIGVANANSTHGFVNRLGFQLVAPLSVRVGIGPLQIDAVAVREGASDLICRWSREAIGWRLANPHRQSRFIFHKSGIAGFAAPATNPAFVTWTERPADSNWSLVPDRKWTDLRPRVFVGLVPPAAARTSAYMDLPKRLRPVPLNLIYKPLTHGVPARLTASNIFFDFLDFDAF